MGRRTVRIAVDANILLRFLLGDDPVQQAVAAQELDQAESVFMPIVALCELVWVLRKLYGASRAEIADAVRNLIEIDRAICDRTLVEAGLELLEAGGDFADGVIAQMGHDQGAGIFVTFDRDAVRRLTALGRPARLAGRHLPEFLRP